MTANCRLTLLVTVLCALVQGSAAGQGSASGMALLPTPVQDDAQLHDVRFVGSRLGWAVGEHGVIWHTRDAGSTWQLQSSGVDCALRAVCFLSDRVGWVAGGGTVPFTHLSYGVVLATTDGGVTWKRLEAADSDAGSSRRRGAEPRPSTARQSGGASSLPGLHGIKFFSLEQGFAVGSANEMHPTGILFTNDGGRTWRDAPGKAMAGWQTADFANMEEGAVAGLRGATGLVVKGQFTAPRVVRHGSRGFHDLVLLPDGKGCIVGDGGLNVWTDNSGLTWQPAPTPLPESVRDVFDFRGVSRHGDKVWMAGQPGSTIWHSPDAGRTWQRQTTRQPLPISAIHFSSPTTGCAVGALGLVLRTDDGGRTWIVCRGAGRRLAILSMHAEPRQVSLHLVSQLSGEGGYRSLVELLPRADLGPDGYAQEDLPDRLDEAVSTAGGSAAEIGWQFPLSIPGLERDSEKLIADWNLRTEGRLADALLGHLVRQIRMWRPSVIVLDQPAADDAVTRLINDAVLKAAEHAADPTRNLELRELGLEQWRVARIFQRLPAGSTGQVHVDPHVYLPRVGKSVHMTAAPAYGRLVPQSRPMPLREAYKRLYDVAETSPGEYTSGGGFFGGLDLPPGSEARRDLPAIDEADLDARQQVARKQRNFSAYIDRFLNDPRHAGQLVGQLEDIVSRMPDAQAAFQISELSALYLSTGQWELAELTLIELVQRYPDEPVSLQATEFLLQSWGSSEAIWRRLQKSGTRKHDLKATSGDLEQKLEQVAATLDAQAEAYEKQGVPSSLPADLGTGGVKRAEFQQESRLDRQRVDEKYAFWRNRAVQLSRRLAERAPAQFASPDVQFPLAAMHRARAAHALSDEIYRNYVRTDTSAGWSQAAAGELWLTNPILLPTKPLINCGYTSQRPILDGLLSDECWQNAEEMPLRDDRDAAHDPATQALAMLCYDSEYLYFAATFPRSAGVRTDGRDAGPRKYDEDLTDFDRVHLLLDVDRDYVTYYSFAIDQRGCVSDSCWRDQSWNPRWFVASDADSSHWRVEVAIPFQEIGPRPPERDTVWSVGIVRTIPAVGVQSWTHPAASNPRPETFGFVRFD